jgi:two-component system KDP operon response regulator KdpE
VTPEQNIEKGVWSEKVGTQSLIMIVEEDPDVRLALSEALVNRGYVTLTAGTGKEALSKLGIVSADLALVDERLPDVNSEDLLRDLRQRSPTTVLALMAANPTATCAGEEPHAGVLHCLLKPFTLDQLVELVGRGLEHRRHRHPMRRRTSKASDNADSAPAEELRPPTNPIRWRVGSIEVDLGNRLAYVDQRVFDLTLTELRLLETLANRAPAAVSHEELGRKFRSYQVHIHNLRQKLESNPKKPQYIINVLGVGYRLAAY